MAMMDLPFHTRHSRQTNNRQFQTKIVCELSCASCNTQLSKRGMRAILLGDTSVELYSTDLPPTKAVELVGEDYTTKNCQCKIRDIACLCCGNVVGYHVTRPCEVCLEACHNGHFWMFHSEGLLSRERKDPVDSSQTMMWGTIPNPLCEEEYPRGPVHSSVPDFLDNVSCLR